MKVYPASGGLKKGGRVMEIATSSLMAEFGLQAALYGIGLFVVYFIGMQCS